MVGCDDERGDEIGVTGWPGWEERGEGREAGQRDRRDAGGPVFVFGPGDLLDHRQARATRSIDGNRKQKLDRGADLHATAVRRRTMEVGQRVQLFGLSRAEFNGRCGITVSTDALNGRVGVRVDGLDKPLSIKPENLRPDRLDGVVKMEQALSDMKLSNAGGIMHKCDGCGLTVSVAEVRDGDAEALHHCYDCGYAACASCRRGPCRCVGTSFGRYPDGTPAKSDDRCICSRCAAHRGGGGPSESRPSAAVERARRAAGDLKHGDDVAFVFHDGAAGTGRVRLGQVAAIVCRCLVTRELEHAANVIGAGATPKWREVLPANEMELRLIWYTPADDDPDVPILQVEYVFDGASVHPEDMKYGPSGMLGHVELEVGKSGRAFSLANAKEQLVRLGQRSLEVPPAARARAPSFVDLSRELRM